MAAMLAKIMSLFLLGLIRDADRLAGTLAWLPAQGRTAHLLSPTIKATQTWS
jgi:hypothetical protein